MFKKLILLCLLHQVLSKVIKVETKIHENYKEYTIYEVFDYRPRLYPTYSEIEEVRKLIDTLNTNNTLTPTVQPLPEVTTEPSVKPTTEASFFPNPWGTMTPVTTPKPVETGALRWPSWGQVSPSITTEKVTTEAVVTEAEPEEVTTEADITETELDETQTEAEEEDDVNGYDDDENGEDENGDFEDDQEDNEEESTAKEKPKFSLFRF